MAAAFNAIALGAMLLVSAPALAQSAGMDGDPDKPASSSDWPKAERALYDQWRKVCARQNDALLNSFASKDNVLDRDTRNSILLQGFDGAWHEKSDRFADEIKEAGVEGGKVAVNFGSCLTKLLVTKRH